MPHQCADSFAAALAAREAGREAPFGNTGMNALDPAVAGASASSVALVDYLKFTMHGLKKPLQKITQHQANDGLEEVRSVLFDVAQGAWDISAGEQRSARYVLDQLGERDAFVPEELAGLRLERGLHCMAKIVLASVAPALVVGELTGRGREHYNNHAGIFTHLGERCGSVLCGGNNDTVHIDLSGTACRRVDMSTLAGVLRQIDHRITRIDAAWDDLHGALGSVRSVRDTYVAGGFTPERGTRSENVTFYDDCGTGKGCTFQLGDRSTRLFRCYEKGKQLGNKESPWTRYEVQYMGSAFDLTPDNILNPAMLLLQYPDLDHLPLIGAGERTPRVRHDTDGEELDIALQKSVKHLQKTCGAALGMLARALSGSFAVELIECDKIPRRFRKFGNSREELEQMLADAALDSRKHRPIAETTRYHSAESR